MMSGKAIWQERLIIIAVCVIVIAGVPYLLEFDRSHAGWSQDASEDLAELSTSARNDVNANYQQFQENLTATERSEMQRLHRMVSSSSGHANTLESFDNWFQQLSPFEREQISGADSVEEQLTVIQTLLAQEDAERDVVEVSLDENLLQFSAAGGRSRSEFDEIKEHVRNLRDDLSALQLSRFRVTTLEFDPMVDTVIKALPDAAQKTFEKSLKERGDALEPAARRRVRVRALLSATRAIGRDYWRNRRTMFEQIAPTILAQLDDSEVREKLKTLAPDQQATIVGAIVMRSVQHNLDLSPYYPNEIELKQFIQGLDRPDQIKLLGMRPERAKFRANMMYVAASAPEDIAENAEQMLHFIDRQRSRRSSPRSESGRPRRPPGKVPGK